MLLAAKAGEALKVVLVEKWLSRMKGGGSGDTLSLLSHEGPNQNKLYYYREMPADVAVVSWLWLMVPVVSTRDIAILRNAFFLFYIEIIPLDTINLLLIGSLASGSLMLGATIVLYAFH